MEALSEDMQPPAREAGFKNMTHAQTTKRLYLINPSNPLVNVVQANKHRWNRYVVWKPLGLLIVAALTPPEWEITVIDENLGVPDYAALPCPDLVGITAFTAQAPRAYQVATGFRGRGVPVVMGGIHATMCLDEALERVDAVVTGEAEGVWARVLEDLERGRLERVYAGTRLDMDRSPPARHSLLPGGYLVGSIQTTRGCPLNCSYCSVTAFNGGRFRHRPIEAVVQELGSIREKNVLIVDDNLIGTNAKHLARAKELLQAMIQADLGKRWVAQTTINFADDEELLSLAAEAGCCGVGIGFESPSVEGLIELDKRFNVRQSRDLGASVRRIQRHGILVLGFFIVGLDVDQTGIGQRIDETAQQYGLDAIVVGNLTPLPGTRVWEKMEREARIVAKNYPEDWKYYTLTFPVARHARMSWAELIREKEAGMSAFYSYPRIARRVLANLVYRRKPFLTLVSGLFYRDWVRFERETCRDYLSPSTR
jgi:radical SAM superfamily enzyme YgiQ (UPF0313 family)